MRGMRQVRSGQPPNVREVRPPGRSLPPMGGKPVKTKRREPGKEEKRG